PRPAAARAASAATSSAASSPARPPTSCWSPPAGSPTTAAAATPPPRAARAARGRPDPAKPAALVLVDPRRLSYAGAGSDPLAALVFSPWPEPVDTVIVNGRLLVEGGEVTGVDGRRRGG